MVVPDEWSLDHCFIKDENENICTDSDESNLHCVSFSDTFRRDYLGPAQITSSHYSRNTRGNTIYNVIL